MRFRLENPAILDYFGMKIGTIVDGLPFNFPVNYLAEHVLIAGMTGTGKSRFAMSLSVKAENERLPQGIRLLIVDVEGEWKNIIPKLKGTTEYFTVDKNLKINPFDLGDPALIRELMRETIFKGIEKEYVDLSAQMNFVLQETISESRNMEDLIKNIKSYNRQKLTSLEKTKTALLVRLDPFMRSPLKEIFLCKKSSPDFSKLDEQNIIIDLHALDALVAYGSELRLIYNTITTYFLRKMLNRGTSNFVSNLFVADEAQLLVPKILHKIVVTESWPATEFAVRLRKRGCGLVLMTQSPSNLEPDIFKNVGTKFAFRLQFEQDIRLISEAAGFFDPVEFEYIANKIVRLPQKAAVVCTSGHEPFLMTADEFDIPSFNVKVDEVEEPEVLTENYDNDEITFLESIEKEPFLSVTERRVKLGWRNERYVKAVSGLLQKRKIERIRVKLGKGSPKILYQTPGRVPGIKHEYYVHWIADYLKARGFKCKKNSEGPDIEVPEIRTAIEVELGKSNMYGNIRSNLQKFDTVIICSDQKKVLEALYDRIKDPKILFCQIQQMPALIENMTASNELKNI
ncbi:MAG: ATP-binding protein [Candidatus Nitrosotenuis sp.]